MAEGRSRKRKHFAIERSRQSPFQNPSASAEPARAVSKAPRGINAAEFAESRALEINNMMQALASASEQSNKRVFQSIPRHMRRRAASHNSKRMPVRLRDACNREALKSKEKQKEPKQKKSRRHRRKPGNLLQEYNRRQRKHVWLETHIWHAKRFKMAEKWGYKIPLHPNDKSIRASYRAMANGCLMQDISYHQCVEVYGQQDKIVTAMKHLTSAEIGLTMAAKEYLNGQLEGHTMLYKYDHNPYQAIGPVMFLWQQSLGTSNKTRLWVWSHPTCSHEVAQEIVQACSLEGKTEQIDSKAWLTVNDNNEMSENRIASNDKSCENPEFTVCLLHEQVARLRLTGPKSHALLAATIELCDWSAVKDTSEPRWWQEYSKTDNKRKVLEEQNKAWEQMKGMSSPGMLKGGTVIALVVKDPRLGLPVRKSSIDMAAEDLYKDVSAEKSPLITGPTITAISMIWDNKVRQEVKEKKMAEKELNNLRSKLTVPGSKLDLGEEASRIPILVIQQSGCSGDYQERSINFGSGYDVIFPAGWSMAFWIAFVYRGARVGGARELATCSRERGVPHFPCDFPDTQAGREYNKEQKRSGEEQYKRYPPAKRANYDKLGITSPFAPDWEALVNEWSCQVERIEHNLKKVLETLEDVTVKDSQIELSSVVNSKGTGVIKDTLRDSMGQSGPCVDIGTKNKDENIREGTERDFTVQESIVMDTNKTIMDTDTPDLQFNVIRKLSTRKKLQEITISFNQSKRNRAQKNSIPRQDILHFLINTVTPCSRSLVCINLRPLFKGSPQDNAVIYIPMPQDLIQLKKDKAYGGPVEHVHKDDNTSSVIDRCSRKAIGWVTSGQYSFARGQGTAIGFCTFPGFCEMIVGSLQEKCTPMLLVRNTNTFQYRFANFLVL